MLKNKTMISRKNEKILKSTSRDRDTNIAEIEILLGYAQCYISMVNLFNLAACSNNVLLYTFMACKNKEKCKHCSLHFMPKSDKQL